MLKHDWDLRLIFVCTYLNWSFKPEEWPDPPDPETVPPLPEPDLRFAGMINAISFVLPPSTKEVWAH